MQPIEITKQAARRYVLGRQGLWPGRRWSGKQGVVEAVRTCEAVQLDPLNVVARSHDIVLWSRVVDYRPEYLDQLTYTERQFFDYGGGLFLYPMEELPYWSMHMDFWKENGRWARFAAEHPEVIQQVRDAIRQRGPLGNRDFDGNARFEKNYRGRKDTALALYALWITGELMVHHRDRFERVYDIRENVVPPSAMQAVSSEEAETYFARKSLAFLGLSRERGWANTVWGFTMRKVDKVEGLAWLERLVVAGEALPVKIEGAKETYYAPGQDAATLNAIAGGSVPKDWQPLVSTEEEVVILAPLDIVSARGRAKFLFDFEYIWEVYKPAQTRRWGYYTVPILYGDRLVARLDPKLERSRSALVIQGFWLEETAPLHDPDFADALGRGLLRFARFVEAKQVDLRAIQPEPLRRAAAAQIQAGGMAVEG
jgi:uncharacterized protein YcaQ